jgi:hypothetical protein
MPTRKPKYEIADHDTLGFNLYDARSVLLTEFVKFSRAYPKSLMQKTESLRAIARQNDSLALSHRLC